MRRQAAITRRRPGKGDAGSAAVELTLLAPLLMLLLMFTVVLGRFASARLHVDTAAHQAARAASIARAPGEAAARAHQVVRTLLASEDVTCRPLHVGVDTGAFHPGGQVAVTVACTVRVSDLSLLRLPGSRAVTSRSVSPIDMFRSKTLGVANSEVSVLTNPSIGGAV